MRTNNDVIVADNHLVDLHAWYRAGGAARVVPGMEALLGAPLVTFEDYAAEVAPLFR